MTKDSKIFDKILERFKFKIVDGQIQPVLVVGDVVDLFTFIQNELNKSDELTWGIGNKIYFAGDPKEVAKKITSWEEDPNEGDNGSHQDQAPEDFI